MKILFPLILTLLLGGCASEEKKPSFDWDDPSEFSDELDQDEIAPPTVIEKKAVVKKAVKKKIKKLPIKKKGN